MELINFPILVTQIIGFLIVLWVLKRYAWGPVLGMLEARRARIANDVASAEKLRREAEQIKSEYEAQIQSIEAESRRRIQAAVAEGERVAEKIREEAHREVRAIAEKAKADLAMEYKKARAELREDMVTLALGAAERLLEERLDEAEHRRLVDRFLDELQNQEAS